MRAGVVYERETICQHLVIGQNTYTKNLGSVYSFRNRCSNSYMLLESEIRESTKEKKSRQVKSMAIMIERRGFGSNRKHSRYD